MTTIPSFVFGQPPNDADLQACLEAGIIPRSVNVFANKAAYERGVGYLAPSNGDPQWWANVAVNQGIGYFRLTGRVHKAGAMSLAENQMYSSWARQFYAERATLDVPEIEPVIGKGWGALSFARSPKLPAEYPLGEIWSWGSFAQEHSFPSDCVCFMLDGQPRFERISEALKRFPLIPQMPLPPGAATTGGYPAAQVYHVALAVADFEVGPKAKEIMSGSGTMQEIVERLVKL